MTPLFVVLQLLNASLKPRQRARLRNFLVLKPAWFEVAHPELDQGQKHKPSPSPNPKTLSALIQIYMLQAPLPACCPFPKPRTLHPAPLTQLLARFGDTARS